jgi:hypothetical protein
MLSLQLHNDLHATKIADQKLPRHPPTRKFAKEIWYPEFLRETDLTGLLATSRALPEMFVKAFRHLEDDSPRLVRLALLAAHVRKDAIAAKHSKIVHLGRWIQTGSDCRPSPHDHAWLSKIPTPRTAVASGKLA